jgi:hypothetical protein
VFGARENAECNAAPAHDLFSLLQERMRKKKVQERMREKKVQEACLGVDL